MIATVVIPTYNESENITSLLSEIRRSMDAAGLTDFEVLVMDDDSPDGTAEKVRSAGDERMRVWVRKNVPRGLSASVLDGFARARGEILVVMDADLSHPPALLPQLIGAVQDGAQVAVASRYVPGGGVENWPWHRYGGSRFASWLARGVTVVRDATSGYFALRRSVIDGITLSPEGFKIGLEIFVKSRHEGRIREVPFVFKDRIRGQSKIRAGVMMKYLQQLVGMYRMKFSSNHGH